MIWTKDKLDEFSKFIRWDKKYTNHICLTGGFFNPITCGHINLLDEASKYGILVVAVNNDTMAIKKSGYSFMPFEHRLQIVDSIRFVTHTIENPYYDMSYLIELIKPDIYAKGGDVTEYNLLQIEKDACTKVNCKIKFNVGGPKITSSSRLLQDYHLHQFPTVEVI